MQPDDRILIGVVGKPHGVRGSFYLDGCVDAPALVAGLRLWLGDEAFEVSGRGGIDTRPIVTLREIGDRSAVEVLRRRPVFAARGDLTPLADGEWFADDLVGLAVVDGRGVEVGKVVRMNNLPSADVLEVAREGGGVLLLPMIRDAIVSIDPEAGRIEVDAEFLSLDAGEDAPDLG
jgi:16S rRNA processing protein RimM